MVKHGRKRYITPICDLIVVWHEELICTSILPAPNSSVSNWSVDENVRGGSVAFGNQWGVAPAKPGFWDEEDYED